MRQLFEWLDALPDGVVFTFVVFVLAAIHVAPHMRRSARFRNRF